MMLTSLNESQEGNSLVWVDICFVNALEDTEGAQRPDWTDSRRVIKADLVVDGKNMAVNEYEATRMVKNQGDSVQKRLFSSSQLVFD